MEDKNKSVFWQSFVLAIIIFALGILLGYILESNRVSEIISLYQQSELDLLDIKIQNDIFSLSDINCDNAFKESLDFADRIYAEALTLEKYEGSNKLTEGIMQQHKKYDLLRVSLLANSLKIQEKCNNNFTIAMYFYEYMSESQDVKALQNIFSKKLEEIKEKSGSSIMLIPIAGNLELNSINYIKSIYGVEKLPAIVLNKDKPISNIEEFNKIKI